MGKKKRAIANKKTAKPEKASRLFSVTGVVIGGAVLVLGLLIGVIALYVSRAGEPEPSTSASIKPPALAYEQSAPKNAAKAYQFAIDRPDLLSQVPCYCGCGQDAGHKSNLDCFIKQRNGDKVLFDRHGAG